MSTLVRNGQFLTLDERGRVARALRLEGGRIVEVHEEEPTPRRGEPVIDLGGAYVVPGLVDAHLHLAALGALRREVDVRGCTSRDEVLTTIAAAAVVRAPGQWLRVTGWDDSRDNDPIDAALLDRVAPRHSVWLGRTDGHAVWLNGVGMEQLDASRVAEEYPMHAVRDARGELTGCFRDHALAVLERRLPASTRAELRADLLAALAACAQHGLTAVHDMATSLPAWRELVALDADGQLPVRVDAYLDGTFEDVDVLPEVPPASSRLCLAGVKLFVDGAMGSRGAALHEPYSDASTWRGGLVWERRAIESKVARAAQAGYAVALHAIGDRGVSEALQVIAAVPRAAVGGRHRIEHAQLVDPEDIARMARCGVAVSMQPVHWQDDRAWLGTRLGDERGRKSYPWRALLDAGVPLVFGSDAPIATLNPWAGVAAATERDEPTGGPRVRLTRHEALAAYTQPAARLGIRGHGGRLEPGAVADLTMIDRDPLDPAVALIDVQSVGRLVAGERVEANTSVHGE